MEVQSTARGQGQIRAYYIQTLLELPILVLLLGPGTPLAPLNSRLGGKCAGNFECGVFVGGTGSLPSSPTLCLPASQGREVLYRSLWPLLSALE